MVGGTIGEAVESKDPRFKKGDILGGVVLDAVLPLLNAFARIPFCGYISEYDGSASHGARHLRSLLVSRVRQQTPARAETCVSA